MGVSQLRRVESFGVLGLSEPIQQGTPRAALGGTLSDFLTQVLPTRPAAFTRTSHEYIWDMLLWHGRDAEGDDVRKP